MGEKQECFRERFRVMLKRKDRRLKLESHYGEISYLDIERSYNKIRGYIECAYDMGIIDNKDLRELEELNNCLKIEWMDEYKPEISI